MNKKFIVWVLLGLGAIVASVAGSHYEHAFLSAHATLLLAMGTVWLGHALLTLTYVASGKAWPRASNEPLPLRLSILDYLKAGVCWIDAFRRTYAVEPGLYFTGPEYDRDAPLLVTSNYLLTVFLVVRHVRKFNARILVVDADGINVWCAAGKGVFSNTAIEAQLDRYPRELLTQSKWLTIVVPKFGFSGVDLKSLRKLKIKPVIGPLYARDLPEYLSTPPLSDRNEDRVVFGWQMRAFSWLPGLTQILEQSLWLILVLLGAAWLFGFEVPLLGVVGIAALLATAYPLLFPFIPGVRFAVKGLWLATFVSVALAISTGGGFLPVSDLIVAVPFVFTVALFFGLAYTGNSAVSNYTKVREETARFLPIDVALFIATIVVFVAKEVSQ